MRYTVPAAIDPERMEETQIVRFRVGNVYKDAEVVVEAGGKTLFSRRKKVLAPGEMEQLTLKKSDLVQLEKPEEIVISLRSAEA